MMKEHVDAVTLSRLANANGSKSYNIQKVGNGAELKKACDEISKDLHERHSYAIGFVAHAPANYASTTIPIDLPQWMSGRYAQIDSGCYQLPSDFGCDETKPVTKSHCGTFGCRLADEKRG
jgi:hypothetical protein